MAERRFAWAHAAYELWPRLLAAVLAAAALLPLARPQAVAGAPSATAEAVEWPRTLDGATLRPLALSAVETRFAARFPGQIARFDGGDATWVLRDVREPTRMLHPAADCFRGLGYSVAAARLETDGRARRWRCFIAERDGRRWRVCERIESRDGGEYTDTSAWYWEALMGRSTGPWRALTRVEAL